MSAQTFVLALVGGSAALALWIIVRFTNFGPRTIFWALVHVVIALVLLRAVAVPLNAVASSNLPYVRLVDAFGVALPLFVYAFLSGGWITRVSLGLLRR